MKKILRQVKTNKIPIMLILISFFAILISISGVSAASTVYVNATGSDSNLGTIDSPYLTIGKGVSSVDENGTVNLADGNYSGTGNTWITVSKNMNITGQSQRGTVINGTGSNWIFYIPAGINVTIQNLTITNASAAYVSAVKNEGICTVKNCTFTGNNAGNGGAIDNRGTCTVSGCTFNGNTATNDGGAIWNYDGSITVENCIFTSNNADRYGGAIHSEIGACNVNNCIFNGNTAHYYGAISNWQGSNFTVTNCNFTDNRATSSRGGAICNYVSTGSIISGCTFTGNTAVERGGAIYNGYGTCTVTNCTFTGNTAIDGGAIYNDYGTCTVESCNFTNNNANSAGGAIYNGYGTCTLSSSTFTNNRALHGAAINNYYGTLTVSSSTFTGNTATIYGGAINNQGTLNVTGSTFSGNTAVYGGSVSTRDCILSNCTFTGNNATYGGAIHNYGISNVSGSTFAGNRAIYFGGAIYDSGTLTVTFNRFYGNTALVGSAICYTGSGTLNATNNWWGSNANPSTISNLLYGSVDANPWIMLTIDNTDDLVDIGGNTTVIANLRYNSDDEDTLAVYGQSIPNVNVVFSTDSLGSVSPTGSIISNGLDASTTFTAGLTTGDSAVSATVDGQTEYTTIRIRNLSHVYVAITGNDTTGDGSPALPFQSLAKAISEVRANGTVHVANGEYKGTSNKGLIIDKNMKILRDTWISGTGSSVIIDAERSGTIFSINSGMNVTFQSLTLTNGTSSYGGAIHNRGNLTVDNCIFTGNRASVVGGAIINWYGTLNVTGCTFTGNTVMGDGGAIGNSGTCTVINSTFNGNNASNGGAIFNYLNTLTVKGCNFIGNTATQGGALANADGTLTAHFNRFYNNVATTGSAVYCSSGSVNAEYNWWSSNANPLATNNLIYGLVDADPWVILTVNANPTRVNKSEISTITADLNHYMDSSGHTGTLTDHIPDGPVTLDIPWGSFTDPGITHSTTMDTINGIITATFYASEGTVNPLFNPVKITATTNGYTTSDAESAYVAINTVADLHITKTCPAAVIAGNQITYTITVTNNGPDYAENVHIIDTFPAGISSISWTAVYTGGATGPVSGTGNLNLDLGMLPAGGSCIITVTGTVLSSMPAGTVITNTATVSTSSIEQAPGDNSATATTTVITQSNMNISKTVDKARPNAGDTVTFTVTVRNNGPSDAINVCIEDLMPSDFADVMATPSRGTYVGVVWTLDLAGGDEATLTLTGKVTSQMAGKNITNTALLRGSTDSANATVYVPKSDLYIKITSDKNNSKVGEAFTLTYKLGNNGPDEATNVLITIPLPEGFEIANIRGDGKWTYNANNKTITWILTNVPVGDPYLYISGKVLRPGSYVFGSSISSETYNINSEGVTPITIKAVNEVKAASKTIPLQKTGLPLNYLVLAILMVLSVLIPKRK